MQFLLNKIILTFPVVFLLSGCLGFSNSPKQYSDVCAMLDDNISWYKDLKYVEQLYGVDMSSILAIIKQESSFKANAKPPRKQLFDTIPLGRVSSSYGYSQAKDETWEWYQQQTGNTSHKRNNFADSAEFIAWYMTRTKDINGVSLTDMDNQYLAYHEGHTGYKKKTYQTKGWLLGVAKKVSTTAANYQANLKTCRPTLDKTYSWSYL